MVKTIRVRDMQTVSANINWQEGQTEGHMINNLQGLEDLLAHNSADFPYFNVRAGYIFASAAQLKKLNQVSSANPRTHAPPAHSLTSALLGKVLSTGGQ